MLGDNGKMSRLGLSVLLLKLCDNKSSLIFEYLSARIVQMQEVVVSDE
jgi:hypothetical protein